MNIVCDTNAVTALRVGNASVLSVLEEADTVFLSVVVLGELLYGYKNGRKTDENLRFLSVFKAKPRVRLLPIGEETAKTYSDLRLDLKRMGRPIPAVDLWLAAQTIENGAALLTNDAHFADLIGLRRVSF
jgi:tRNA(fMet)-specific endonuclease VapC